MERHIVLAPSMRDVETWRLEHRLPRSAVIGVTPDTADRALRGLTGHFEVITHESWAPTPAVRELVEHHLAIIRLTTPTFL
jgi:hypothetical protein